MPRTWEQFRKDCTVDLRTTGKSRIQHITVTDRVTGMSVSDYRIVGHESDLDIRQRLMQRLEWVTRFRDA